MGGLGSNCKVRYGLVQANPSPTLCQPFGSNGSSANPSQAPLSVDPGAGLAGTRRLPVPISVEISKEDRLLPRGLQSFWSLREFAPLKVPDQRSCLPVTLSVQTEKSPFSLMKILMVELGKHTSKAPPQE